MSAYKKRMIEDECRVFNEEWTVKYHFTKVGNKAIYLLCGESVAVFKEYSLLTLDKISPVKKENGNAKS